jgi:hypothetical protein
MSELHSATDRTRACQRSHQFVLNGTIHALVRMSACEPWQELDSTSLESPFSLAAARGLEAALSAFDRDPDIDGIRPLESRRICDCDRSDESGDPLVATWG